MLVEINLLPEKPKKNFTGILYLASFLLFLLIATSVTVLYHNHVAKDIEELQAETYEVQLEAAVLTQELTGMEQSNLEQLEQAAAELEATVIPASSLTEFLVSQLPERGFIRTFYYEQPQIVQFDVSFDRLEQIAQYHEALESSHVVSAVQLTIVDAVTLLDEEAPEVDYDAMKPRYHASFNLTLNADYARMLGEAE